MHRRQTPLVVCSGSRSRPSSVPRPAARPSVRPAHRSSAEPPAPLPEALPCSAQLVRIFLFDWMRFFLKPLFLFFYILSKHENLAVAAPNGTTVKFEPVIGQDTMQKNGTNSQVTFKFININLIMCFQISTKHMCITAMKQYESKCIEVTKILNYLKFMNLLGWCKSFFLFLISNNFGLA